MLRAAFAAALLLLGGCEADTQPAPPAAALELTGRVVDAAGLFEPGFEAMLTQKLASLEEETLVQLVVTTTPDLKGADIADYSRDLGNAWGIGDAARNDGLLIVVAPSERKVRIEVGLGLEELVKDEEAFAIIQDSILPHFGEGDYQAGVNAGVDGLIREVTPVQLKEAA